MQTVLFRWSLLSWVTLNVRRTNRKSKIKKKKKKRNRERERDVNYTHGMHNQSDST